MMTAERGRFYKRHIEGAVGKDRLVMLDLAGGSWVLTVCSRDGSVMLLHPDRLSLSAGQRRKAEDRAIAVARGLHFGGVAFTRLPTPGDLPQEEAGTNTCAILVAEYARRLAMGENLGGPIDMEECRQRFMDVILG
ncbi:hypothetical protein HYH02_015519 [Chlamydomonas schloesseri]|uniref:Uncharacterized protein n=1 Tax=Chlamydomonas schloesseri TaxID=2026947 RepID=A0A835SGJ7_9CHLO|nr:hypothetical protein HYH02_015519 [Chlamydomonas schloesseri]|eukprot:KAG2422074.1 hypothetical protein HYH02_015519 [Chlamydomonas schloesseri]